ncbi:MAG TPA: translocation/assembly module TamB domain-containing protein [Puia sp.]|nr:translocation/assembly module TamB domain-containing protein [Puia sp.]
MTVGFPKKIILKNIFLGDLQNDTLLYGGKLELDVNLWKLLSHTIVVNEIDLDQFTVKVKRTLPDSSFNFDFIAKAFSSTSAKESQSPDTTAAWQFELGRIHLKKIRSYYKDDATGNEAYVYLADFETRVKTFDLVHDVFSVPEISLSGVSSTLRQYKPILLLKHVVDTVQARSHTSEPVTVKLGSIHFQKLDLHYANDPDSVKASLNLGLFNADIRSIDLRHMHVIAGKVGVENTVMLLQVDKKSQPQKKQNSDTLAPAETAQWKFELASLQLVNNSFQYDNAGKKPLPNTVDYNHLKAGQITLDARELGIGSEGFKGKIRAFSFSEKSGFVLKQLSTAFAYDNRQAQLSGTLIQTNRSLIRAHTLIRYASLASISKKPAALYTDLNFDHSSVAVKDILLWVPALKPTFKGYEQSIIRLNGKIIGFLGNLNIPDLELAGLSNTTVWLSGSIKGLPSAKKAVYDLRLRKLVTSRKDLEALIPPASFPDQIRLPEQFSATGFFNGTIDQFKFRLVANTSNGNTTITGRLNIPKKDYDLTAHLEAMDLGYLFKQDSLLGKVSMDATARGNGFDYKTMNARFHAVLLDAVFKGYAYKSLNADAVVENGSMHVTSSIDAADIRYNLEATGNVRAKYPSIILNLEMDTVNLHALHLAKDTLGLKLNVKADFASTDPDALQGKIDLYNLSVNDSKKILKTDTITLVAARKDSIQNIHLHSEMAEIDWVGQYRLTEVGEAMKQTIDRYYKLPEYKRRPISPENWQLQAQFKSSPLALALMPSLKGTDTMNLHVAFNSVNHDLQLAFGAPLIHYNSQVVHGLSAVVNTKDTAMHYIIHIADAVQPGFRLYQSTIQGSLAGNRLFASIILKDSKSKDRYYLATKLNEMDRGWRISFDPDSLMLNYDPWNVSRDNYLQYDSSGLVVHNLKLDHKEESLLFSSSSPSAKAPLGIVFKDFRIKTITSFTEQDSLLLDGVLNGKAEIRDFLKHPVFTSDLTVQDLAYKKDTLGNLVLKINNEQADAFAAKASIQGHHNDVSLDGIYYSGESKMDLKIIFGQLNLVLLKTFAGGEIRDISGYLKGNLQATGSLTAPVLKGNLHFDSTYITPTITGERLKLSSDPIEFDEDGFNFSEFVFLDSAGNKAILDGNIFTRDFKQYRFDLSYSADNFRLINAPKSPNSFFYGKLNLDADVDVVGDLESPKVNANLRVNKQTDFTVILPSNDPEIVGRQGVVVFVDKEHPTDTARLRRVLDSLSRHTELKGMDVTATIETDSNAVFTMIIDERNGDALSMRGRADLVGGIDKSGKITLTGNYELENGSYNLSLSLLKRKFIIQRGSTITWTGDPRTANVDITATYMINAPSIDLVQQQLAGRSQIEINRFKQKLPFRVNLRMQGELLKPIISFDISLPQDQLSLWPEVDLKLQQIKTDQSEVNKQVFALLLLNRFVSENPFVSAAGGTDAGTLAKQSASKILTDQVNSLAASLIKGVELSVDLNSDKDYSSGQAVSQTQLNVGVSKNLFNDRIRVSVGSNFQLEQTNPGQDPSNLVGDVNVDYRLSKDGRYMLRAYRRDQYTSVIEGQVVETGLSFILTFDYNEFFELFRGRKAEEQHRLRKHKKNSGKSSPNQ